MLRRGRAAALAAPICVTVSNFEDQMNLLAVVSPYEAASNVGRRSVSTRMRHSS